ncbi:PQQ-binding-like beta-propeller repeat protein [Alteribacter populi]|uniref:outer membrane protein assembly factor BamB family protein n=1 Tax=Alteribacter populi TaxID=2011011 RepID=UPI000BBA5B26|nr:PQQ-binding-like beta-propeller repeat protein [Alteribacter populi]
MKNKLFLLVCSCLFLTTTGCTLSSADGSAGQAQEVESLDKETNSDEGLENQEQNFYEDDVFISAKKENNPVEEEKDNYEAIDIQNYNTENLHFEIARSDEFESDYIEKDAFFPEIYTEISGVLNFRGGPYRDSPSFGRIDAEQMKIENSWSFRTGFNPDWGGGAGWTGQPAIVKWPDDVRKMMNIVDEFKENDEFVEVIQGSLDGNIYFLDLETGKETRDAITVKNPIKGSLSIDSRGYPLLYVGDGVPQHGRVGFYIYSLIDGELLYHIPGVDAFAYREWGAFDGSALINRETDTMVVGGENGVFYRVKLNTHFNKDEGEITIDPEEHKLRYQVDGNAYQGIENSVAVHKNLAYFADNGGSIVAVNLQTMKPVWALPALDDTDATVVLEVIEDVPYLYTGSEVDNVGRDGESYIRKIHGLTGEVLWKQSYTAFYYPGVVGGVLATPVLGKENIEDMVIFTVARHNERYAGIMIALDKKTGEEVWTWEMPHYAWSSAVDVYDEDGNGYLIQADSQGNVHILDGNSGELLDNMNFGYNIEASPAVYNNSIVFASRGGEIHRVELK